jgi:chromosome segregation protein
MRFTRLRLSGFKSFVDPTELLIEPGLTGIVGPNGCGKSNLVEALRWVMGETSAKRMRGGEMDDVIFGGTGTRPARNIAEVALLIDNSERKAPALFNEEAELEVVRRIERGAGSAYRINDREVRAKDVQLLFADAATGAHSASLVSQGRIGAIINAKPAERRVILEEAAGIAGLHARRHEAELRLKAAEANLARLDDVIVTLRAQHEVLKKQARQAGRYRRLSEHIRRAEAIVLHLAWLAATSTSAEAAARLREAEEKVAELTQAVLAATRDREAAADALPGLRQAEAASAAELQRLLVAREQIEEEERRVRTAQGETEQRLRQTEQDVAREEELAADAAAAIRRLEEERAALSAAQANDGSAQQEAAARLREAADLVAAAEAELAALTEEVAAAEARRGDLARRRAEAAERQARLAARLEDAARQRRELEAQAVPEETLAAAAGAVREAEAAHEKARIETDEAAEKLRAAQAAESAAREAAQAAETRRAKLAAEAQALTELLQAGASRQKAPPILDALEVAAGYEAALGAALGDDLAAPLAAEGSARWEELPPYDPAQPLPDGVECLADHVAAPAALARRLSQIGVVADAAAAAALWPALRPGQRLVTRAGGLWRWDGFEIAAGAPTAAAQRLQQRNRLAELRKALTGAESEAAAASAAFESAKAASRDAVEAERAAQQRTRDAIAALARARDTEAELARRAASLSSRLAALAETIERLEADRAEAAAAEREAGEGLAALPDAALGRERLNAARMALSEKRAAQLAAQAEHDRLVREATARTQRIAAIKLEIRSWQGRAEAAQRQIGNLAERRRALEDERERLARRPAELAEQRTKLADAIEAATLKRRDAGDALAVGERTLADAEKRLKAMEQLLASEREERVRREAAEMQAREAEAALLRRIEERLDVAPEEILAAAEISPEESLPPLADAEARLERLVRERDGMGPVNLVAEAEAEELETRIAGLEAEREDLTAAIARLRQGIAALNREGRERLVAAFAKVNEHFEQLFTRLFGGGRAHLALDEDGDPLEAGLEIMASPPGKRLQTLSLLSGGEQALTAIALLFAVFLTNPAPICVLDEVDAPLDDANVDRFCRLVEEIAESTGTRFLLITHHRITMARMDRLFGVTMAERGVSQLVSVDLQAAVQLRKTAA